MYYHQDSNIERRVAIYIRVSTNEQKVDGYGLEAQRSRLLEHIKNNKHQGFITKNEWIYTDTHTGSDLNREALKRLLKDVKDKKFDSVMVFKIDRLSRSLKHLINIFDELEQNQVSFISMQENIDFKGPIGKLIFQVFGAIAQFERELIKGRTSMGKIVSAEMGNFTGSFTPYGYKPIPNPSGKGKRLEIIPEEKKWVEQIFNWYIYDNQGYDNITTKLNELRVPRGEYSKAKDKYGNWTVKMVRSLLERELYRGEFVANKTDDDGNTLPEDQWTTVSIPQCISPSTFTQAQNKKKSKSGGRRNPNYLLSGKLKDMTLDKPKSFSGCIRSKGGYSYRRKQFKKDDEHFSVFEFPGKQMDDYVWGKILTALKDPKVFIKNYLSKEYVNPGKLENLEDQLRNLREQKINNDLAIDRVEEAFEKGSYSEEKMSKKVSEKNSERAEIENKIQEIEDELTFIGSIDIEVKKLKEASKQIKYRLDKLSQDHKRILVDLFIDRIEMYRTKEGKRWKVEAEIFFRFNPEKFPTRLYEGRSTKALEKANNQKLIPNEDSSGAGRQD